MDGADVSNMYVGLALVMCVASYRIASDYERSQRQHLLDSHLTPSESSFNPLEIFPSAPPPPLPVQGKPSTLSTSSIDHNGLKAALASMSANVRVQPIILFAPDAAFRVEQWLLNHSDVVVDAHHAYCGVIAFPDVQIRHDGLTAQPVGSESLPLYKPNSAIQRHHEQTPWECHLRNGNIFTLARRPQLLPPACHVATVASKDITIAVQPVASCVLVECILDTAMSTSPQVLNVAASTPEETPQWCLDVHGSDLSVTVETQQLAALMTIVSSIVDSIASHSVSKTIPTQDTAPRPSDLHFFPSSITMSLPAVTLDCYVVSPSESQIRLHSRFSQLALNSHWSDGGMTSLRATLAQVDVSHHERQSNLAGMFH